MVKQCLFCGRYFTPDCRVKDRQKACRRAECRKARKKAAQTAGLEKNPGYFANLYENYVKPWRKRKIKDERPPKKPLRKLIILIPDDKVGMIKDEMDRGRASAVDSFHRRRILEAQGEAPP